MTENLDHLDDLPKRDPNRATEEKAETDIQGRLTESGPFILQRAPARCGTSLATATTTRSAASIARRPIGPNASVFGPRARDLCLRGNEVCSTQKL